MPSTYRLIHNTVEAIQLTPSTVKDAALWCGGMEVEEIDPHILTKKFVGLNIPTLKGVLRASENSFIIKNHRGEFSVMGEDEFLSKYEKVLI